MDHDLATFTDAETLAKAAADYIAERARRTITSVGQFTIAVSGGATPWAMFKHLAALDVDWSKITIYQVDERAAPIGDPDRNLTNLQKALAAVHPLIAPMPVDDQDLESAAARYGAALPVRIDLVHLGLGPDGHTASLVPDDPVLDVTDRPVAITGEYQGRSRMTLTYPGLARADQLLWLVSGADKREPLALLLGGDTSIPAGRVAAAQSLVMADATAL